MRAHARQSREKATPFKGACGAFRIECYRCRAKSNVRIEPALADLAVEDTRRRDPHASCAAPKVPWHPEGHPDPEAPCLAILIWTLSPRNLYHLRSICRQPFISLVCRLVVVTPEPLPFHLPRFPRLKIIGPAILLVPPALPSAADSRLSNSVAQIRSRSTLIPNASSIASARAEAKDSTQPHQAAAALCDNPYSTSNRNTTPNGGFRCLGPIV